MRKTSLVAVCDILGFGDLCQRKPPEEVADASIGWLKKALHHCIHKSDFPKTVPSLGELRDQTCLGVALFSDTVFLYTLEDSDENCRNLVSTLAWFIFETMRRPDIRVRCGVAHGDVYVDQQEGVYVGSPFVEAHKLQEAQKWAGGALADTAVLRIPSYARDGRFADWFMVPYPVPMGSGKVKNTLAINWTAGIHPGLRLPWDKDRLEPSAEEWKTKRDVCQKWQNTVRFHDDVCKTCTVSCLRLK